MFRSAESVYVASGSSYASGSAPHTYVCHSVLLTCQ